MAEEAPELTAEELELQAKQAAKQRQTEYRKTAKLLKSKKPAEKLEAIEKLSDHGYLSEVSRAPLRGVRRLARPLATAIVHGWLSGGWVCNVTIHLSLMVDIGSHSQAGTV